MGRAPCCDKAIVKRGPWSPEEDAKLKAYIEEHGTGGNWIALPHKIGLKRCGKSCRLRWLNYLRPNIKHGGFSEEEDNIICNLYISIGSRWSIIAAQLPGRTDNDIKNYWNTRLKKKLLGRRKDPRRSSSSSSSSAGHLDQNSTDVDVSSQTLSASAIERMQLHMQLQGLNGGGPFSFYNNHPALWPRFHPLAERLGLQTPTPSMTTTGTALPEPSSDVPPHPPSSIINGDVHAADSLMSGMTVKNMAPSAAEGLQEELMSLIYGKNIVATDGDGEHGGHRQQQHQQQHPTSDQHELDCFKETDHSDKESLIWWANHGFGGENSISSSSWESAASAYLLPADESIFQDYMLGYDIF